MFTYEIEVSNEISTPKVLLVILVIQIDIMFPKQKTSIIFWVPQNLN